MNKFLLLIIFINLYYKPNLCVPTDAVLWSQFQQWSNQYGKQYQSIEIQEKFQNWKTNALQVNENNAQTVSVEINNPTDEELAANPDAETIITYDAEQSQVLGMNQFSDMTNAEFINSYTGGMAPGSENVVAGVSGSSTSSLSSAAIAGIAVASAFAVAAITVGSIFGYKRYKKLNSLNDNSMASDDVENITRQEEHQLPPLPQLNIAPTRTTIIADDDNESITNNNNIINVNKPFGGVDIVSINSQRHNSITGRGVPIKLDSKIVVESATVISENQEL